MQPVAPAPGARIRPSGWWYLVAVGLVVLGCVLGVMAVVRGFQDAEDTALSASAAAPGTDQLLTLDRLGGYTIAYSGPVIVRSTQDQRELAEGLDISIVPADGGAALPLEEYDGLNDVEAEGQQYVPLLTVQVEEEGDYILRSALTPQVEVERSALVVSDSPFRRLRSGAERGLVLLVGGIGLGILVAVIIGRTRGRAKAAARAAAPPWPGPWGGPPAPPALRVAGPAAPGPARRLGPAPVAQQASPVGDEARGGPGGTSTPSAWRRLQLAWRSVLRAPQRPLRSRTSTTPVSELRMNMIPGRPETSLALTTWPLGSVTRVPAVT